MDVIGFGIAVYGAVSIATMLSKGTPFAKRKPFSCPLCMGFWCALALLPATLIPGGHNLIYVFAGCGIAYFLSLLVKGKD